MLQGIRWEGGVANESRIIPEKAEAHVHSPAGNNIPFLRSVSLDQKVSAFHPLSTFHPLRIPSTLLIRTAALKDLLKSCGIMLWPVCKEIAASF